MTLKHMSRNTLCRRIEISYEDKMQEISDELREKAIYVCTTADKWTSRSRRFTGVTAHWVRQLHITPIIKRDIFFTTKIFIIINRRML